MIELLRDPAVECGLFFSAEPCIEGMVWRVSGLDQAHGANTHVTIRQRLLEGDS